MGCAYMAFSSLAAMFDDMRCRQWRKVLPFPHDLLFSNVCVSVCVPICCWLNFMWIICSIILNIFLVLLFLSFVFSLFLCRFAIFLYVRMSSYNGMFYMLVHVFIYMSVHRQRWRNKDDQSINHDVVAQGGVFRCPSRYELQINGDCAHAYPTN